MQTWAPVSSLATLAALATATLLTAAEPGIEGTIHTTSATWPALWNTSNVAQEPMCGDGKVGGSLAPACEAVNSVALGRGWLRSVKAHGGRVARRTIAYAEDEMGLPAGMLRLPEPAPLLLLAVGVVAVWQLRGRRGRQAL